MRNRPSAGRRGKGAAGGVLLGLLLALLLATPARAQLGNSIPSTAYYGSFPIYYDGEYRGALGAFQNDLRGGIKSPTSRWVDSICYYTMCGECYYQMGQFPDALNQYTSALKLYAAFYDWMVRIQFPATINAAPPGARALVTWGASRRNTRIGQFPESFSILQGQLNNNAVIQQGGVVQAPMLVPVRVSEIVRTITLAMRRRRELMGPVCKYDPLTNEMITLLSRRAAPPNNWSQAWIDVQLGAAYASAGNVAQAASALERSLVVGDMDHPLTGTALLELGQLALQTGDLTSASRYFDESTYAAATFSDPGLLEEAFRLGQMTHLLSNAKGIYPPLLPAISWSQQRGLRQLNASLTILAAENFAVWGQTPRAVALIGEASRTIGRRAMAQGSIGARLNMVTALANYQTNQVPAGDLALASAMAYQKIGSLWMFHINLVDGLYMDGSIFDRVATLLYDFVLRDPTPADWATSPLESLSVMMTPHPLAYEHWFEATLKRNKEPELALEIADRARRHRYFSTLPMGGRLLGLRWILEGPKELLNEQSLLQRQDLLAKYTRYQELAVEGKKIQAELAKKAVVDDAVDARREQAKQLAALGAVSQAQEVVLREIGVRREPAEMVFPPLRKTKDVQLALPEGHALLAFFATSNDNLYAFLFSKQKYAMWKIGAPAQLRRHIGTMLKDMGNTDHNHQLSVQDLGRDAWKKSAAKVAELLFDKSNVDLSAKFEELVIVPDGLLWYLPFEALPVGKKDDPKPLISQVRIRYAPTVGLAIPYHKLNKPNPGPTGVVIGKLYPHDDESVAQDAFEPLSRAVDGAVALPRNPTATSSLLRMLLDGLIVLDEIKPSEGPYGWTPVPPDGGKPGGALLAWLALPWGGPERVILPGFHTAAENGLRKGVVGGNDLFLSVCGLLSTGTRTVLISRWRTAGQTSFDLVREFAQELAHTSAADAWQRAVQLVGENPLDGETEPRLKKFAANTEPPKSDHPFFWAAYMLVDSGRLPENQEPPPPPLLNAKKNPPVPAEGDVKQPDKKGAGRDALPPAVMGPPIGDGPAQGAPANDAAGSRAKRSRTAKDGATKDGTTKDGAKAKPPRGAKGKAAPADQP